MAFVPFREMTFETHLNQGEAIEYFRKAVFTNFPPLSYYPGPTDYLVDFHDNQFTANRIQEGIPGRRNPARIIPVIHGYFIDRSGGAILVVKMYPHFSAILIVGGLILVGLSLIFYDVYKWIMTGYPIYDGIAFLIAPVLAYILLVDSFDTEMKKVYVFLQDLYNSKK